MSPSQCSDHCHCILHAPIHQIFQQRPFCSSWSEVWRASARSTASRGCRGAHRPPHSNAPCWKVIRRGSRGRAAASAGSEERRSRLLAQVVDGGSPRDGRQKTRRLFINDHSSNIYISRVRCKAGDAEIVQVLVDCHWSTLSRLSRSVLVTWNGIENDDIRSGGQCRSRLDDGGRDEGWLLYRMRGRTLSRRPERRVLHTSVQNLNFPRMTSTAIFDPHGHTHTHEEFLEGAVESLALVLMNSFAGVCSCSVYRRDMR